MHEIRDWLILGFKDKGEHLVDVLLCVECSFL